MVDIRDVTESRPAEDSLRESEQRYRSLIELCSDAILILDADIIRYCNPACLAVLGASSPQELLGRPSDFFFHPEERKRHRCGDGRFAKRVNRRRRESSACAVSTTSSQSSSNLALRLASIKAGQQFRL
jgi:PAS domain-containing protein